MCVSMGRKLRIGGFLRNANISDVDFRHPEKGNPGVGGTKFGFVSLMYYLKKYRGGDISPVLYAQSMGRLPDSIDSVKAATPGEAIRKAAGDCDMFLLRVAREDSLEDLLEAATAVHIPLLIWAQNSPWLELLNEAASHSIVKRIVCVGQEELDRYRDHSAFYKSRRIFNGIDPAVFAPSDHRAGRGNTVVYLGSLVPAKGFHKLARVWPQVRKRLPDAELIVIGSGTLYDRSARMGEWGIAAEEYEKRFRPYLSDSGGTPLPSVTFEGNMGAEKIPLLQKADVGVPNPTGETETFCWSAIEFQASGTPVVSAAEGGLLDTVQDGKTGFLIQSDEELVNAIVRLLENRELREKFGQKAFQFVEETFSYEKICDEWCNLFRNVEEGTPPDPKPVQQNLFYRHKWLREGMRLAKRQIPLLEKVPSLGSFRQTLRKIVRKF
jgi:glycosyltransferase involved in cell wall biosynthesis